MQSKLNVELENACDFALQMLISDPFTAVEAVNTFTEMRFSEWDRLDRSGSAPLCKLRPKHHHNIIFK